MPGSLNRIGFATSHGLGFGCADDECLGADGGETVDVSADVEFDDVAFGEGLRGEGVGAVGVWFVGG